MCRFGTRFHFRFQRNFLCCWILTSSTGEKSFSLFEQRGYACFSNFIGQEHKSLRDHALLLPAYSRIPIALTGRHRLSGVNRTTCRRCNYNLSGSTVLTLTSGRGASTAWPDLHQRYTNKWFFMKPFRTLFENIFVLKILKKLRWVSPTDIFKAFSVYGIFKIRLDRRLICSI